MRFVSSLWKVTAETERDEKKNPLTHFAVRILVTLQELLTFLPWAHLLTLGHPEGQLPVFLADTYVPARLRVSEHI